ncbi:MAG: guanylate kinase [Verrucomicrobiota bacterium]|nr:guanylate kinase [Verrucomicrobiota bacterium]
MKSAILKTEEGERRSENRRQKSEETGPAHSEIIHRNPLLILISAPSGGGKTTLCQQLLAHNPNMSRAVTCTTRPSRPDEKDGVDYYFLDAASFLKRVQAGNFLEHATVYGNSYGILKSEVLEKLRHGHDVLLNVDVQGAATVREKATEDEELKNSLVTVFLTPATIPDLEQRLKKRGQDSHSMMQKRLSVARQEIAQWKNFDYLIISTAIAEDLRRMTAIVEAEKMRQCRAQSPAFD